MKLLLLFILFFTAVFADAQIQFRNTNDVENAQWELFYASQKVRKITVYQLDEQGKRLFPMMPQKEKVFNAKQQLTTTARYKFNWKNNKPELLQADSFFYNDKGQQIRCSAGRCFKIADTTQPKRLSAGGRDYVQ